VRVGEFDGLGRADWSKTSDSFPNGACVEVTGLPESCFSAAV
jgi:hypothetical protein